MIESVQFRNFKALRNATLPLSRFTLLVGPNGSGKSTALQALQAICNPQSVHSSDALTKGLPQDEQFAEVILICSDPSGAIKARWTLPEVPRLTFSGPDGHPWTSETAQGFGTWTQRIRLYSFDPTAIIQPVMLDRNTDLSPNGHYLVGILDRLRDSFPERFEALNGELGRWLPEFDRVLFDTPHQGGRSLLLRTRVGQHAIRAPNLSQGTLLGLAILTLAYLSDPPSVVCLEEPDRGIHPRLLRHVRDALYRLSHPESVDESRAPVQVIATTHSPYFLDLYKDRPEEIVIAHKEKQGCVFKPLVDHPDLREILGDAHLGDVWYSGILGGVPTELEAPSQP